MEVCRDVAEGTSPKIRNRDIRNFGDDFVPCRTSHRQAHVLKLCDKCISMRSGFGDGEGKWTQSTLSPEFNNGWNDRRHGHHLGRCAACYAPLINDHNGVCQTNDSFKSVLTHDDGEPLRGDTLGQKVQDLVSSVNIEPTGRFIQNQQSRFCRECRTNRHPLRLATRKLVERTVREIRQVEFF